jgi:protein-L-isoaspartate(D-aspartate) O-methyltransferase
MEVMRKALLVVAVALMTTGAVMMLLRPSPSAEQDFERERKRLVDTLRGEGITDARVLEAMGRVPRHRFVPESHRKEAYRNTALPIGSGQTISQPLVVALMTQALELDRGEKVLEIGTGSGYQAAVLAELGVQVYSIEILPELAERARAALDQTCYSKVQTRTGDGYLGWPEAAPFDAVIVTAAPDHVPQPLVDQLAEGGRMVLPVGPEGGPQKLRLLVKKEGKVASRDLEQVLFVPLVRESP